METIKGRWRRYVSPKPWYLPTSSNGVTTYKNNSDIFIAVRISNLTFSEGVNDDFETMLFIIRR
jgi:hypothetical protein